MIEQALETWLRGRMERRDFDPREFRLSESGACPRKRILRALGYPPGALTEDQAAIFEEGRLMEDWLAGFLRDAGFRVERQVPVLVRVGDVPPFWGHADFLVWPCEDEVPMVVECKTVQRYAERYGLPRPEHVRQVQAYLHFGGWQRAEIVYFLKGRKLEWRVFPVSYSPEVGADIEQEIAWLWDCVLRGWVPEPAPGYRPDRYPCGWRTEEGEGRCEMWGHCWADGAAAREAPVLVDAAPLREYADLRRQHSALVTQAEELRERMAALEERMAQALGGKAGVLEADGIRVRGTPVPGRVTYDVEAAVAAGAVSEEALAPYRKEGRGYWRWTLTLKGGESRV